MNNVIEFQAFRPRKVRGTDVKEGQTLYAVQDKATRLYFIWAYSDKAQAEEIAKRVQPGNNTDIAANWRKNLEDLVATDWNQV